MKPILLFLILIIPVYVTAFNIAVLDSDNNPVENAAVICQDKIYLTNTQGNVFLSSKPDSVTVIKLGFESASFKPVPCVIKLKTQVLQGSIINIVESRKKNSYVDAGNVKSVDLSDNDRENSTLENILKNNAGIYVTGNKFTDGGEQKVSLKGKSAKHTLILLDGVPLNKSGQAYDLSAIPLNIVERIDILEGNSTYSSGAAGGIISIKTRSGNSTEKMFVTGTSSVGSYGNYTEKLHLSASNTHFSTNISGEYNTGKNNFEYEDLQGVTHERSNNDIDEYSLSGAVKTKKLGITGFYNKFDRGTPGAITYVTKYEKSRLTGHNGSYLLSYRDSFEKASCSMSYLYSDQQTRYDNMSSEVPTARSLTKEKYRKNDIRLNTDLDLGFMKITQVTNYTNEYYNQQDLTIPVFSSSKSLTMQNLGEYINLGRKDTLFSFELKYSGSLKGEISSENAFEDDNRYLNYSGAVEVSNELPNLFRVHYGINYGQAYTVPSFYDLYWKGDSRVKGNPDLKEEKLIGTNTFMKLKSDNTEINVELQKSELKDMIYWYKSLNFWTTGNIADAEYEIWDLNITQKLPYGFSASIDWKRNFALNKTDGSDHYGKNIPNIFSSETRLSLKYKIADFESGIHWERFGRQWKTNDNLNGVITPYELLNASFAYRIKAGKRYWINCSLSVDNILNTEYEIQSFEPQPGTTLAGSISLKVNI